MAWSSQARGNDNISCYYAEPYQRRWLLEAAAAIRSPNPEGALRDGIDMNDSSSEGQLPSAAELAGRLNRQRAKWLEAVVAECRDAGTILGKGMTFDLDRREVSVVTSAFQAVHVLSFTNSNHYVATERMGLFTRELDQLRHGEDDVEAAPGVCPPSLPSRQG